MNTHFSKEFIENEQWTHEKKVNITKHQINAIQFIRYHFTHDGYYKKRNNCKKLEPLCVVDENVKQCCCCGKQCHSFSKVKYRSIIWFSNSTSRYTPKRIGSRDLGTCTPMFIADYSQFPTHENISYIHAEMNDK